MKLALTAVPVAAILGLAFYATRGQQTNDDATPLTPYMETNNFKKPDAAELKKTLTPEQFAVTQHAATEPPFANKYWNAHGTGIYVDIVSGHPLFSSLDKFDSGCGWPSFSKAISGTDIVERADNSVGMERTEVRSAQAFQVRTWAMSLMTVPRRREACVTASIQRHSVLCPWKKCRRRAMAIIWSRSSRRGFTRRKIRLRQRTGKALFRESAFRRIPGSGALFAGSRFGP